MRQADKRGKFTEALQPEFSAGRDRPTRLTNVYIISTSSTDFRPVDLASDG